MRVLSLFDGMSCGQIALKELGINYSHYYASEIDKPAILQTQENFPNTIQLGDVCFLRKAMMASNSLVTRIMNCNFVTKKTKDRLEQIRSIDWSKISLILAGSPCQGFSFSGKGLAFNDPRSRLFFEFEKILKYIKRLNPNVLFLLENVNMKKKHMRVINQSLGIIPVRINSSLVSAQLRDRWYWTNIKTKSVGIFGEIYSDIPQPIDRGIFLKDILDKISNEKTKSIAELINKLRYRRNNIVFNSGFIQKNIYCFAEKKHNCLMTKRSSTGVVIDDCIRRLSTAECARLQTIPPWYKWVVSEYQIYHQLGNGWTIEVIKHIFSFIKK